MDRHIIKSRCSICHGIVYADQGYHGISEDHYDCHTGGKHDVDVKESVQNAIAKGDKAMSALLGEVGLSPQKPKKPRARAGTGALAQHVKQLVINAVEAKSGQRVARASLWLQDGDYRGPKWDLDSWGVDAVIGTGNIMVCCSSLAAMGDYRRCKTVHLGHDDIHDKGLHYDISVPKEQTKL
ncbi:MAG: hypothetical protein M0003_02150 [Acidithiobacillus sp.]|nr:hypothetical protein [Acidithiobacillus sp.]